MSSELLRKAARGASEAPRFATKPSLEGNWCLCAEARHLVPQLKVGSCFTRDLSPAGSQALTHTHTHTHTGDGPAASGWGQDRELARLPLHREPAVFLSQVPSGTRRQLHSNGPWVWPLGGAPGKLLPLDPGWTLGTKTHHPAHIAHLRPLPPLPETPWVSPGPQAVPQLTTQLCQVGAKRRGCSPRPEAQEGTCHLPGACPLAACSLPL